MLPSSSQNFVVKFPKTVRDHVTIVVSKNVAKRAVDRNRIKRITKEALRKVGTLEKNVIVIVKNNIADKKTEDVYKEISKIFA